MEEVKIDILMEKARLLLSNKKAHFHMLIPNCIFNDSPRGVS